jgi:predicted dehydrogenase
MTSSLPAAEAVGGGQPSRRRIGVGLIGFGWLGQAHSRSLLRIPTLFGDRDFDVDLVVCADPARRDEVYGYGEVVDDWRRVVEHPGVDSVYIAAPNMLHVELIEAAAAAGKDIFCEKPVGGTPEQTERAARAARDVITGVGYNYRWAPLVRYAAQLIADGRLGEITNYRGRVFSR